MLGISKTSAKSINTFGISHRQVSENTIITTSPYLGIEHFANKTPMGGDRWLPKIIYETIN